MTVSRLILDIDRLVSFGHSEAYGYRMTGGDYGALCIRGRNVTVEGITAVPDLNESAEHCSLELTSEGIVILHVLLGPDDQLSWKLFRTHDHRSDHLLQFLLSCNQHCKEQSPIRPDHRKEIKTTPFPEMKEILLPPPPTFS